MLITKIAPARATNFSRSYDVTHSTIFRLEKVGHAYDFGRGWWKPRGRPGSRQPCFAQRWMRCAGRIGRRPRRFGVMALTGDQTRVG